MKALIVHREEAVCQNIKTQLGQCSTKSYCDGLQGLIAAKLESFDLILCGQDLPVVTGIEMIRSIRNRILNKRTPVILLAEGSETKNYERIAHLLNATLMRTAEVKEMKSMILE